MTFVNIGAVSIGNIVPLLASAQAAVAASAAISLPEISAKLAGLAKVQVALTIGPPTLSASIEAAAAALAKLQAAVQIGIPVPTLQATAIVALIAQLEVQLADIQAYIAFAASLGVLLGGAGFYAYTYSGKAGDLIPGGLPGGTPADPANALILVATTAAGWASIQSAFATS